MAAFYVFPPRPVVGEQIAEVVRSYLPGVRVTASDCVRFLEGIAHRSRSFLIHREDLPEGQDVPSALRDGFGAGPEDRIVQVTSLRLDGRPQVRILASPVA
jgi:hypothetical protein